MAKSKPYDMSEKEKHLEQRKRNKINIRHNSPNGKSKGQKRWIKTRRRIRRKLLDR